MDYEKQFQNDSNACGNPFPEIVKFFDDYKIENARVLDLGCGQGRDALFIASKGHDVTGVDISPTGVSQMVKQGNNRHLNISGIVSDIINFKTRKRFDVILIDRVLHILPSEQNKELVLRRAISYLRKNGHILIADTNKNEGLIADFLMSQVPKWKKHKPKKGFLFYQQIS